MGFQIVPDNLSTYPPPCSWDPALSGAWVAMDSTAAVTPMWQPAAYNKPVGLDESALWWPAGGIKRGSGEGMDAKAARSLRGNRVLVGDDIVLLSRCSRPRPQGKGKLRAATDIRTGMCPGHRTSGEHHQLIRTTKSHLACRC